MPVDFNLTEIRPNTQVGVLLKALSVSIIKNLEAQRSKLLCAGVRIRERSEIYERKQIECLRQDLIRTNETARITAFVRDASIEVSRPVQDRCEGECPRLA